MTTKLSSISDAELSAVTGGAGPEVPLGELVHSWQGPANQQLGVQLRNIANNGFQLGRNEGLHFGAEHFRRAAEVLQ